MQSLPLYKSIKDVKITESDDNYRDTLSLQVPLTSWTPEDVETWLKASNLEKFAPKFKGKI